MKDLITIILLILLLVLCCVYQSNKPPVSGVVIDKYITYGRYGGPHYNILIQTENKTFSKQVNHYDYYNGYFIGYSYDF